MSKWRYVKQLKGCNLKKIKTLLLSTNSRFLVIGGLNTIVGYFTVTIIYFLLASRVGIIFVGIISNVVAISIAFTLNKIFVFRTRGNWLREYLRSYITYASTGFLGIFLLWLLVGRLGINIWISQAAIVLIVTTVSFFGHKKITFKSL